MFFSLSAEQISWVRRWLIHTSPILLLFSHWPGHYTGKSQAALHPLPLTGLEPCIDSLANQEVLRWQLSMLNELGDNITHEDIKEYLWKTLKSGQVVPGLVTNVFPGNTANNIQLWARCFAQVRSAVHCAPGILRYSARLAQEPYDSTCEKGVAASR